MDELIQQPVADDHVDENQTRILNLEALTDQEFRDVLEFIGRCQKAFSLKAFMLFLKQDFKHIVIDAAKEEAFFLLHPR